MNFQQTVMEDRRLSLLLLLSDSPGYSANAFLLQTAVNQAYGHSVSIDQVRTDLAWLGEQGLLSVKAMGDVVVATMTVRGADVAAGRATVPGVKRPLP